MLFKVQDLNIRTCLVLLKHIFSKYIFIQKYKSKSTLFLLLIAMYISC